MLFIWCPEWGSNPHPLRDTILSRARIPIPPSGQFSNTCCMEAWAGIEPAHVGFADRSVTTSPPRLRSVFHPSFGVHARLG